MAHRETLRIRSTRPAARSGHLTRSLRVDLRPTAVLLAVAFAAPASAERPLGLDVSSWQTLNASQWTQIHNAGYVFCFARASYGWGYTDSQFLNHMANGKAAGLYMGAYHFSYAGYSTGNTPINEANTFLSAARNYITAGYLRPVLDVEYIGPSMNGLTLSQWCNQWMDYVQQQTGVEPLIYCNLNYALNYLDSSVKNRDLWIASWWTVPDPQNGNPNIDGFSSWAFWQYTDSGSVAGISPLDLDVFHGTLTELQNFVISGPPGAEIGRTPAALSPIAAAGSDAPSQTFSVFNSGDGTLSYTISEELDWLAVSPLSGTSTGETDTITVSYTTAALPSGTYTGTITISDIAASSSPQTVEVTLTVQPPPGDFDGDGHIDQSDVTLLRACISGPDVPQGDSDCQAQDLDHDGDVDQTDFGKLQACLGGAFAPADPYCAD